MKMLSFFLIAFVSITYSSHLEKLYYPKGTGLRAIWGDNAVQLRFETHTIEREPYKPNLLVNHRWNTQENAIAFFHDEDYGNKMSKWYTYYNPTGKKPQFYPWTPSKHSSQAKSKPVSADDIGITEAAKKGEKTGKGGWEALGGPGDDSHRPHLPCSCQPTTIVLFRSSAIELEPRAGKGSGSWNRA